MYNVVGTPPTFSDPRKTVFEQTAEEYQRLLDEGVTQHRTDLIKFAENHAGIPEFHDGVLDLAALPSRVLI